MFQIDVTIVNRAMQSLGLLTRKQEDLVVEIDRRRQVAPYTKLKTWERHELKTIGRIFDIYPDSEPIQRELLPPENRENNLTTRAGHGAR